MVYTTNSFWDLAMLCIWLVGGGPLHINLLLMFLPLEVKFCRLFKPCLFLILLIPFRIFGIKVLVRHFLKSGIWVSWGLRLDLLQLNDIAIFSINDQDISSSILRFFVRRILVVERLDLEEGRIAFVWNWRRILPTWFRYFTFLTCNRGVIRASSSVLLAFHFLSLG